MESFLTSKKPIVEKIDWCKSGQLLASYDEDGNITKIVINQASLAATTFTGTIVYLSKHFIANTAYFNGQTVHGFDKKYFKPLPKGQEITLSN